MPVIGEFNMKKSILIIQQSLVGGGAERVLIELICNFDYDQYDVTLLLIFNEGIYLNSLPKQVKKIYIFSSGKSLGYRLFQKMPIQMQQIYIKKYVNRCYDSIISFMEGITLKYHTWIKDYSTNNITWVHIDLSVTNWPLSSGQIGSLEEERMLYSNMDKIIFVSEKVKLAFENVFPDIDVYKKVIYNIVDSDRIRKEATALKISKSRFTICNVGRLAPQKRHDRLLEAVKIISDSGVDLECWILGLGPLEKMLKERVKELGLDKIVLFKGFQSNPYPFIKVADIFVLSSDTEGYPIVVCEALVLGKPIVSTRITGTTELLGDSEYGILTDLTSEDIAKHIMKLYLDRPYRTVIEKKAREHSYIFKKENILNQIYNIL